MDEAVKNPVALTEAVHTEHLRRLGWDASNWPRSRLAGVKLYASRFVLVRHHTDHSHQFGGHTFEWVYVWQLRSGEWQHLTSYRLLVRQLISSIAQ